ncbi:uncharacterized protein LOC128957341 isoform X2 [Oppia nitens]|uniref:uncharacterized protein LOC128957341 isoform X2 n=1 Tax=Oppia nitens TaxID=1686743 RepID=UPI0023DB04E7|nr:uncharacterized protein LOC128957341 isoform X2 [Oppia nitens]
MNSGYKYVKLSSKTWLIFIGLYLIISCLMAFIEFNVRSFIYYFGVVFGQQTGLLKRQLRCSIVSLVWLTGSMIMMYSYSGVLLTFLVFRTPYEVIDSIEDLANKANIGLTVFDDEPALDYVMDVNEPYYRQFVGRVNISKTEFVPYLKVVYTSHG